VPAHLQRVEPKFRSAWARVLALLTLVVLGACSAACTRNAAGESSSNLLAHRAPFRAAGVEHVARLTDARADADGSAWNGTQAAVLASPDSLVEYDLGQSVPIDAAFLQADNNDVYEVLVSEDGRDFRSLWRAPVVTAPGLRSRYASGLGGKGRFVRLVARGGDSAYSVTELSLFQTTPAVFPPHVAGLQLQASEPSLGRQWLVFGAALVLLSLLSLRRSRWWWIALLTALPLAAAYDLLHALHASWPVGALDVSLARAVAATVAGVVVAREVFAPKRFAAHDRVDVGVLSVAAVLALACFFNLGRAQFRDDRSGQPSYVHSFDMRVYYPTAKYFAELGYEGVYLASVAAYADDDPTVTLDSLAAVSLRDLRTHRMTTVAQSRPQIEAVQRRFTPARWEAFKADMRYFRKSMGVRDYLGSLYDHGANATPVWMTVAHWIFALTSASDATLLVGGALDPLLLLILFAFVGRTFGVRTMLVSAVVFGATDFYMFGTNWVGATLRHDWMVGLGIGLCALRRERWVLAGALIAWAAMIRAFPALALAGLMLPAFWWMRAYRDRQGRWPSVARWRSRQSGVVQVVLGASVCACGWLVLSASMLGVDAWTGWMHKISLLAQGPHVNHVSLRALVSFSPDTTVAALSVAPPGTPSWADLQLAVLRSRMWLYAALIAAFVLAVITLARKQRLEHAALLGLLLVPVLFNPSNYYMHLVFLLPLLALERRLGQTVSWSRSRVERHGAAMWLVLLGLCALQYFTVLTPQVDLHFIYASVLLLVAVVATMLLFAQRDRVQRRRQAGRSSRRTSAGRRDGARARQRGRARYEADSGAAADAPGEAASARSKTDDIPRPPTA
jgi:hypothetical protein